VLKVNLCCWFVTGSVTVVFGFMCLNFMKITCWELIWCLCVSQLLEDYMLRGRLLLLLCFSKNLPKGEIEVPILCWLNFCIFHMMNNKLHRDTSHTSSYDLLDLLVICEVTTSGCWLFAWSWSINQLSLIIERWFIGAYYGWFKYVYLRDCELL
jgi:hypothetical protein